MKAYTKNSIWLAIWGVGTVVFGALLAYFSFFMIWQVGLFLSGAGEDVTPKRALGLVFCTIVAAVFFAVCLKTLVLRIRKRRELLNR